MQRPPKQGWSWEKSGESPIAKGAAALGIALLALWAYATWDAPDEPASTQSSQAALRLVTSIQGVQLGEVDYAQRTGSLRLGVRKGVVRSIGYVCKEGRDATALNHVACHAKRERIVQVFGERVRMQCAKVKPDDPRRAMAPHVRAYDAVEFGTRHVVIRDVVNGFIVTDPEELESLVGYNWEEC
ncbi:MAG: hypothetical protein M3R58_09640 [Pseudomonadota bacterium]|nr:hypothetical protein [Pseudomonadota bacterium]